MTMMRIAIVFIAVVGSGAAAEAAPPPGAASCSGCHAMRGSTSSAIPGIKGRAADETFATMVSFRDGSRPATVMNRLAKGFSDDELRAISVWLAAQK